jgi:hypothetical protein
MVAIKSFIEHATRKAKMWQKNGATTLSLVTPNTMALSIIGIIATLSISIVYTECQN